MKKVWEKKTCNLCEKEKTTRSFHKNSATKDGLHTQCKPCRIKRAVEYAKEWRARPGNMEKYHEYQRVARANIAAKKAYEARKKATAK